MILSRSPGGLSILSAIDNTGVMGAIGDNLTVAGAVTGAGLVRVKNGTADFSSSFAENVIFSKGTTGELGLADSVGYTGKIWGFSTTGATSLDLGDIAFGAGTTASFSGNGAGGVLTVTDGTNTAMIHLVGNFLSSTFTVASDGHGGTTVTDPTAHKASAQQLAAAMSQMSPGSGVGSGADLHASGPTALLLAAPASHA